MPMIHTHQSYCSTLQQFGNQKLRQKVANLKPVDESERKRTDRAIENIDLGENKNTCRKITHSEKC